MTNSSTAAAAATAGWQHNKQQQKYMTGKYQCILVRRIAAYSIIIIYQVQAPYSETTHGA